jgi:hypothetical protein
MAKLGLVIKFEGGLVPYTLYDDGFVYSRYETRKAASEDKAKLIAEQKLADAVANAVDTMMNALRDQFPKLGRGTLATLVVENLQ